MKAQQVKFTVRNVKSSIVREIDAAVRAGRYASRADFVRKAIRNALK